MKAVEYYDEEFDQWIQSGLMLCQGELLCVDCKKDREHISNCDFVHYEVPDESYEQVILDKVSQLESDGYKVRVVIK